MRKLPIGFPYIVYWSVACLFSGVILAPLFMAKPVEDHSTHYTHDHSKMHGRIEVDPNNPPRVKITVRKDKMSGWNLHVMTENFKFTPENVNQKNIPNQGHAHIYVNDKKLTRLYANHYHLSNFPPGKHKISVSLNGNDHALFLQNGVGISASVLLVQAKK